MDQKSDPHLPNSATMMTIARKFTAIFLALILCLTTVACGGGNETSTTRLSDGEYQVQQVTYDDTNGEYTLFLLNSQPPTLATDKLQMARLTDDEIKQGKNTYLKVEKGQSILYLTPDFQIGYVHNVTENRNNSQTGQQETVVVRQENGFWAPFAGAIAGQAIGSLLFRPQYYVPPVHQPGGVVTGYGGYGSTYNQAVQSYQSRYNQPPPAVRNRVAFRTTGSIRRPSPTESTSRNTNTGSRPTGSGFGSSTLRSAGKYSSNRRPHSSFGSGGRASSPRRSSFGTRRR
jgi:archaellum component FlaG (FlaF/FlaG flagellin family)